MNDTRQEAVREVRRAVEQGLSFDEACSLITFTDRSLRDTVITDSLKAIIAEAHCAGGIPLKNLAMRLRVSLSRLLNAKADMGTENGDPAFPKRGRGSQVA